jgi:cell division protease FtsH
MVSQKEVEKNKKNGKKGKKKASIFNNIFFYILVVGLLYVVMGSFAQLYMESDERPLSELITLIQEDKVQDIIVDDDTLEVMLQDGSKFKAKKESSVSFDEILANNQIDRTKIAGKYEIVERMKLEQIITPLITVGVPVIVLLFILRQMRGASGDIMSFGKSRARMFNKDLSKITFDDVAGVKEAKSEVYEIVDFLKHSDKYRKLGARIPKGILLVGPSGVGKTLLAKAIAGEAGVPFFSVAGSEFMEMLVGVGSARARDLFKVAKENQPSLIFIDEIDAIGRQRGMGIGGGHDEREQTLNQILIEMDGFDPRTNVIVIAATNRPDMLDPALVRPGRFDRKITIPMPDLSDREEILKIHMRNKPFTEEVSLQGIAKRTVGFSGADLENMLNESAIMAARADKKAIDPDDIEEAALKVTIGSERKTLQSEEERKMAAYHEAGHALVASNVPDMDPVHTVSIVARGGSLGHTSFPPARDRYNETRTRLMSVLSTMLGGRAAEETVFGELTIGASDDINKATTLARQMVTEYGMSSLGPISYDGNGNANWLAKDFAQGPTYSDAMISKVDNEIKRIMDSAYETAKNILVENRHLLDKVTNVLLEKETIREDEYLALIKNTTSEVSSNEENSSD